MSNPSAVPIEERTYIRFRTATTDISKLLQVDGKLTPTAREDPKFKGWQDGVLKNTQNPLSVEAKDRTFYNIYYWFGRHYKEREGL